MWRLTGRLSNWHVVSSRILSSTRWCTTRHRRPCWPTKERSEWDRAFKQTCLKCYKKVSQSRRFTLDLFCITPTGFVIYVSVQAHFSISNYIIFTEGQSRERYLLCPGVSICGIYRENTTCVKCDRA